MDLKNTNTSDTMDSTPKIIENKPKNSIEEVITSEKMEVVLTVQKKDIFVVQQWTDERGYTWRNMSDGSTQWWDGLEWKHYGEH